MPPSAAAPPTPGGAVQTPALFIRWQSALAAHLERFKRYPTAARAHREQGIAKVAFTIDHEGHLLSSQIVQSSRSSLLDQEPAKNAQTDKDTRWTKKHGKSFYGYKNHVNADAKHKLIRSYDVSDASVHDSP